MGAPDGGSVTAPSGPNPVELSGTVFPGLFGTQIAFRFPTSIRTEGGFERRSLLTMAHYRNPAIRQLKDQQVRYMPRDVRLAQIERAERLVHELDSEGTYHYQDLCQKITEFRPELYPDLVLSGEEAAHDLRLFIEDLSDSADIPADSCNEEVWTVEQLSRQFNVSTKTVDRWRNRGLVSRRFLFGNRKRVGFLRSSVERFLARQGISADQVCGFSRLTDEDRIELRRMIEGADVVVEASRPRALEQLGIDRRRTITSGSVRAWLSITAHGSTGEAASRVGFGDDAAAAGGLLADGADGPRFIGDAIADPITGILGFTSLIDALLDGRRDIVDVSLAGSAALLARSLDANRIVSR